MTKTTRIVCLYILCDLITNVPSFKAGHFLYTSIYFLNTKK